MKYFLGFLLCFFSISAASADIDFDNADDVINATGAICSNVITPAAATLMGWIRVVGTPGTINNACSFNSTVIRDNGRFNSLAIKSLTQYCYGSNDGAVDEVLVNFTTGWHHLAGVHTGGNLILYVDGVASSPVASGNNTCSTDSFIFGHKMNNRIAGIMIYPSALSAGEIANIAGRRQLGPLNTRPSVDVRLDTCADGASGNTVVFPDRSGNGNNGTGDRGANATGLTCRASEYFRQEWGPQ